MRNVRVETYQFDGEEDDRWTIEYYEATSGEQPTRDWVLHLPPTERGKLLWVMNMLETVVDEGTQNLAISDLGDGAYEFTARPGNEADSKEYRVIYIRDQSQHKLVLLHGFENDADTNVEDERNIALHRLVEYAKATGPTILKLALKFAETIND